MTSMMGLDCRSLAVPQNLIEFRRSYSQNTGNLLFHYGIELLAELEDAKLPWSFKNRGDSKSINVLIPMANLIGPHIDLSDRGPDVSGVGAVTVLGLGAQFGLGKPDASGVPSGSRDWIRKVSRNDGVSNIGVRGNYTLRILKELGCAESAVALGCPSNFISSEKKLGKTLKRNFQNCDLEQLRVGVSVTAGSFQKREYWKLERSLISLLAPGHGKYLVQNPWELIALSMGWYDQLESSVVEAVRMAWFPDISSFEMRDFFLNRSEVYISVPQWLFSISKSKFVVGTRIHGIQAALQAGVPAVCLCIDSRTKELCEFMKLPYVMAPQFKDGVSLDDLTHVFQSWNHDEYDDRRLMLARRTKRFLQGNNIKVKEHLLDLCSR